MGKMEASQIIRQLKTYQDKVTSSPQLAREALMKAGLIDKGGRPTPPYRPTANKQAAG